MTGPEAVDPVGLEPEVVLEPVVPSPEDEALLAREVTAEAAEGVADDAVPEWLRAAVGPLCAVCGEPVVHPLAGAPGWVHVEPVDVGIVHVPTVAGEVGGLYEVVFDTGIGLTTWVKTAAELLQVNGSEPLVAWLLRESELRGYEVFSLRRLP